ncbi:unnamed protein product [Acanthoscelides obtectus]|uniref:Uncharacterized protein n=1 Tax=Acanthoscelides obtectus TaxID=200917 RepID=A0A9P0K3U2_ACAOB|nr:unnamed protein product [Acanthoscelides obtectus]CAK1623495.1 General transcription factor II-I repeat domain-containing protein 2 [Acanthoscelides obtectus]
MLGRKNVQLDPYTLGQASNWKTYGTMSNKGGNRALTHRKFRDFLAEVDATYGDLLLHTGVRWLSAGKCLQRFFALRKEIPIFLKNEVKSDTTELENQMADAQFLADLAFLTDMTSHLNELNLKLQGKQQNIANLFGHINGCKEHFEEMKDFEEVSYLPHIKYIDTIAEEFKNRFSDFKKIGSDISVFTQILTISVVNVSRADLQLELCDLQPDPFYQGRTETGLDFFKLLPGERYRNLRNLGLTMGSKMASTQLEEKTITWKGWLYKRGLIRRYPVQSNSLCYALSGCILSPYTPAHSLSEFIRSAKKLQQADNSTNHELG